MMVSKYVHVVAKAKLWERRKYLVRVDPVGDVEYAILRPTFSEVEKPSKPVYTVGSLSGDTYNMIEIEFAELKDKGYTIASLNADEKWFKGQVKKYLIVRKDGIPYKGEDLGSKPSKHKIIYDTIGKRFRLEGRNAGLHGVGGWTYA